MSNKSNTFESSIAALEKIIKKLDSDTTSLDEMIKLYEDGIKLTNLCKAKLDEAENRITTLIKEDDEFKEVPGI